MMETKTDFELERERLAKMQAENLIRKHGTKTAIAICETILDCQKWEWMTQRGAILTDKLFWELTLIELKK